MKKILFLMAFSISTCAIAWDGTDQNGNSVEIEKGNLVRKGLDIDIYSDGEYKNVEVISIRNYGRGVEIEVYDSNSDEYSTLDMD